jgi:hypothetical protein
MTEKELEKVTSMLRLFEDYPTWTKVKRSIFNCVIQYIESGTHEYFTSSGGNVGTYYIETKDHNRRGFLKKYRGKKLMVMTVQHGSWNVCYDVVAVIED